MIHVDDIVYSGTAENLKELRLRPTQFGHGPWGSLSESSGLVFLGAQIDLKPGRIVEFPHRSFSEIVAPGKSELISGDAVCAAAAKLQKSLRGFIGSCLWLTQTRFDVPFGVCALSSSLPYALRSIEPLRIFLAEAQRLYSRIADSHHPVTFGPLFPSISQPYVQLFSFSDASFGTLRGEGSVEANIILIGLPIRRDGIVERRGQLVSWHFRRSNRARRSTAQAEGLPLSNAGELAMYFQIPLTDILGGEYQIDFLRQCHPLPSMSPFKSSPSATSILSELHDESHKQKRIFGSFVIFRDFHFGSFGYSLLELSKYRCSSPGMLIETYRSILAPRATRSNRPSLHALLLTDCSNVLAVLVNLEAFFA